LEPTPNELLQTSTSALSNKLIQRTRKLAAAFSVNTEVSTTAINGKSSTMLLAYDYYT